MVCTVNRNLCFEKMRILCQSELSCFLKLEPVLVNTDSLSKAVYIKKKNKLFQLHKLFIARPGRLHATVSTHLCGTIQIVYMFVHFIACFLLLLVL